MKRLTVVTTILLLCLVLTFALAGCDNTKYLHDAEYNAKLNEQVFWDNDITEAIPQINVSSRIREFLDTPSKDGKKKKVLFLGYDGCRADRMVDILDPKTGKPLEGRDSAILETLAGSDKSGLYLAYCGGNMNTNTRQATVTGCGWASLLTGVWQNKHKIVDNRYVKNPKYRTFLLDATMGEFNNGYKYSSLFVASSTMHFATQYIDEINFIRKYPKDGATMPKEIEHKEFIREKSKWSESYYDDKVIDYTNKVMAATSLPIKFVPTDESGKPEDYAGFYGDYKAANAMIEAINSGTEVVFGILEDTDHVGHNIGFSKENEQVPAYKEAFAREEKLGANVIRTAKERIEKNNEDWLIVVSTDHGGYNDYHGQQSFEERTTWVACNQGFDIKYYSQDYDGFKGKLRE